MQRTNIFEMHRYTSELKGRFHEMPVGDPMSGAPYGEYLKSKGIGMLIGVVAAVVTMGAALPMLAVGMSLASQIAGGVMMAGGVLSGVGAVTGNKKLMKIGGIMSLAGGIGGLAIAATGGATGAIGSSLGTGSEAVSNMANTFMDSASSMSGGLLYGDRVAGAAEAANVRDMGIADASLPHGQGVTPATDAAAAGQLYGPPTDTVANTVGTTSTPVLDVQAQVAQLPLDAAPTTQMPRGGATGATANPVADPQAQVGKLSLDAPAAPGSSAIDPANITNDSTQAWKDSLNKQVVNEAATKSDKLLFGMDKTELMKTGGGFLKEALGASMGGDAAEANTEYAMAKAREAGANATLLATQNEAAQFKLDRQKNNAQSIMLSADDPELEAKLAKAKAGGVIVGIIPSFGKGGIKKDPNATWGNAARMSNAQTPSGQQVARQLTFAPQEPTTGILNKAA